jgi:cytochrome c peroxidase
MANRGLALLIVSSAAAWSGAALLADEPTAAPQALVELGRQLFFDPALSADRSVACATCHRPDRGWADGQRLSQGIGGQTTRRHTPSLVNAGRWRSWFWDGRAKTLEQQVLEPIYDPREMGSNAAQLQARLLENTQRAQAFREHFGRPPEPQDAAAALSAFVRLLESGDTPYDRFRRGDTTALSAAARRGHDVFFFRSHCSTCHVPPLFTDHQFHNIGIGADQELLDAGREQVSGDPRHRGAFRTPSLRDVDRTAPYMHDGRFATLEQVIEYYAEGAIMNPFLDELMNVMPLDEQDKSDLAAFLREGLQSVRYPREGAQP